ncbi:MAG: hypothetical protein IKL68_04480, partial [Clostridia bacterium]|nr:hypothetical protein [Clostridia bacterium]
IATLQAKLVDVGLTEQESYGAIINYAIGNGNYFRALGGLIKYDRDTKDDIETSISENDINWFTGKTQKRNSEILQELGVYAPDVDDRNIDYALRIVSEYDFEGVVGRELTDEEKKALLEALVGNKSLNKGRNICIATLQAKLVDVGLTEQESYGAIINYAIGNGNYSKALGGLIKYDRDIKDDIETEIIEESITKAVIKYQKKAAKLAKSSVSKETITQIDDTLSAIDEMVATREQQKTIE